MCSSPWQEDSILSPAAQHPEQLLLWQNVLMEHIHLVPPGSATGHLHSWPCS
ncbi:hypothetical protein Nmel_012585 [Mimus melanotis]